MRVRNLAATFGSVVLIAAPLALAASAPASADEVWHQSIGRASAESTCASSTADELAAGWSEWAPSWSHWMNDGMGGYTCNRQLTWLFGSPASAESESESGTADEPAVEGCILTWSNPQYYYFKSGSLIAEEYSYKNASCTSVLSKMVKPAVYADDQTTANTLCKVTSGTLQVSTLTKGVSEKVWLCP